MEFYQCVAAAEAILFAAGEPVSVDRIALALDQSTADAEEVLTALAARLESENSGLRLIRLNDKAQLCTRGDYAACIRVALETRKAPALSQAALEVLAIVAYRQPVTKGDIEGVRGVKCDYSVQALLNRGFIEECGRRETLGRPILYRTTDKFLQHFGIETLEELPNVNFTSEGEMPI